jgi:rhodanese-related sulfurtransferase
MSAPAYASRGIHAKTVAAHRIARNTKGPTMKRLTLSLCTIAVALAAGNVAALTADEYAVVQRLGNEYLSSLPDKNYYEFVAEDVAKMIREGRTDFVIVDVRVPKEKKFDVAHLPNAMFIAAQDVARPENLAKLPKDKKVIVHCDTGQQQNKVLTVLRMLGYDAYAMKWGYMAWSPAPPTAATLDAINGSLTKAYPVAK